MATINDIKQRAIEQKSTEERLREKYQPSGVTVDNRSKVIAPVKPKQPSRLRKIHEFDFKINKENAPKILPFILFVTMWVIIYIANNHYAVKTIRNIDALEKEMKDLKADYYTSNAELSNKSMQSKVAKMVEPLGLKELTSPPKRLKLIKNER